MSTEKTLKSVIAEIKESYDLSDYIENTGVALKRSGMRSKGLCPFHNENTPSFTIDESFQTYRCFGCGANGDIIHFVQEYENMSFWEALESLAHARNIDLPTQSHSDEEKREDIASLKEIVRETALFFWKLYQKLPEDHIAKKEISKRNLSIENKHNIYGYAPEGKDKLYKFLKSRNYTDDAIERTGVCRKSDHGFFDSWQGRLMFIISDISGKPVGFSGRKLYDSDKMGKYVNSIDSPVFYKSNILFNVSNAKKVAKEAGEIYVAEGQFDVMSIIESGNLNVVAASGTAFTDKQSSQLRRLVGEHGKIVFVFDGDEAGKEAARRVFDVDPMLHNRAYVVSFPDGQDPDDYARKNGHQALHEYISSSENRMSITEFVLHVEKIKSDMTTPEGRSRYLEQASEVLSKVSAQSLRIEYSKLVSLEAGGINLDTIEDLINQKKEDSTNNHRRNRNDDSKGDVNNAQDERFKALQDELLKNSDKNEEEISHSIEIIKQKFSRSPYYTVVARLLWIALSRRDLAAERLFSIQKALIPSELRRIVSEIHQYPKEAPLIAEKFTDQEIVHEIISHYKPSEYFVASDDEMVIEMIDIIFERLVSMRIKKMRDSNRAKLTGLIAGEGSNATVFKKIIEQEEEQYRQAQKLSEIISYHHAV